MNFLAKTLAVVVLFASSQSMAASVAKSTENKLTDLIMQHQILIIPIPELAEAMLEDKDSEAYSQCLSSTLTDENFKLYSTEKVKQHILESDSKTISTEIEILTDPDISKYLMLIRETLISDQKSESLPSKHSEQLERQNEQKLNSLIARIEANPTKRAFLEKLGGSNKFEEFSQLLNISSPGSLETAFSIDTMTECMVKEFQ
ncbi:MAG: hypothetical protein Q4P13_06720 [Psychrobacter sp.]|nr:hypothetical protein [Psychrobacter sp.]